MPRPLTIALGVVLTAAVVAWGMFVRARRQLVVSLRDVQPWVDPGTSQAPLISAEPMSGEQWVQLVTASLLWIGVPMAVGVVRMLRAEVK